VCFLAAGALGFALRGAAAIPAVAGLFDRATGLAVNFGAIAVFLFRLALEVVIARPGPGPRAAAVGGPVRLFAAGILVFAGGRRGPRAIALAVMVRLAGGLGFGRAAIGVRGVGAAGPGVAIAVLLDRHAAVGRPGF